MARHSAQHPRCREPHASGLGANRWSIERTIAWFHQFRRIHTRRERDDVTDDAFTRSAASIICFRRLQVLT